MNTRPSNGIQALPPDASMPPELAGMTPDQFVAYVEDARQREVRAGDAARREQRWRWAFWGLVAVAVPTLLLQGALLWQTKDQPVHVHTVERDSAGNLLQEALTVNARHYMPLDGHWRDMLREWVTKTRWKGTDPVLMQASRRWVQYHTCGKAQDELAYYERKDQLWTVGHKHVVVQMTKPITKTVAPKSWQVVWTELVSDTSPTPKEVEFTGVFTVSRILPDPVLNPLGLCVDWFNF